MSLEEQLLSLPKDDYGERYQDHVLEIYNRFSFSLRLPQAVNSGAAAIMLPVTTNSGAPVLRQLDISMVPDARQVDLSADYVLPVGSGRDVIYSAEYSLNFGHVAGQSDTNLGVGWRMQF